MSITEIVDSAAGFAGDNTLAAAGIGLVCLVLLWRRPKMVLFLVTLVLLLAGVAYFISAISGTGKTGKQQMIEKSIGSEDRPR